MSISLVSKPYLRIILSCLFCFACPLIGLEKPNVVVILADDLGLGDIGRHHLERTGNAPLAPTPAIDALWNEGMWFTDAHSPAALCAPSRYSVMTGNYNFRSYKPGGVWGTFDLSALSESDTTLGTVAQAGGYTTGFVGKWHMGGDFYATGTTNITRQLDDESTPEQVDMSVWVGKGPQNLGFDYDFTVACGVQGPTYVAHENGVWYPWDTGSTLIYYDNPDFISDKGPGIGDSNWNSRELNILLADKAVDFIASSAAGEAPFMLYYCSPAVHLPHTPPAAIDGDPIAGTTPSDHLDMNRVLDLEVKKIVDALKAAGVYDNTLIIFTSDNGGLNDPEAEAQGHRSSGGFTGTKNSRYEGGHRVPFIAVWPSVISANTTIDAMINGSDILATIAEVMGSSFPTDQAKDSHSLFPIFLGNTDHEPRTEMMQQGGSTPEIMFRDGPWKLIMESSVGHNALVKADTTAVGLFNLDDNPNETESSNFINDPAYASRVGTMYDRYWAIREAIARSAPEYGEPPNISSITTSLLDENFSSIQNGVTTAINQPITDGSYDSGLNLNNNAICEITTNVQFGSGNVLQLTTGANANGGFGALSNSLNPYAVSMNVGDEIDLTFDILVQAVPATASSVTVELRMTGATDISRTFTEYINATVGDTVSFSWTVDVDSDIANASDIYIWIPIEGIANNFDTEGPNNDGTELDVMQLDNIKLTVSSVSSVNTGFDKFKEDYLLTNGSSGDDDNDSLLNGLEYAFGSDPSDSGSAYNLATQIVQNNGNQHMEVHYSRRKSASQYSALRVWRSTELTDQSWKLGETAIISITDDTIQTDLENVVERSIYPMSTTEKEFFRMDVIIAP
ncbi:MAG: arylsulfatase [Opitutae bacterium]|nr:arylsulfatase [Opitutae bacterium]MDG1301377.1 arylsulfatase [Opitutae bacterium]